MQKQRKTKKSISFILTIILVFACILTAMFSVNAESITVKETAWGLDYSIDYNGFCDGIAVFNGNKWGYIDKTGKAVIPFIYENRVESFSEGLARIEKNDWETVFIDKTGKEIISGAYFAESFKDGMAVVMNKDIKIGFIDKTGTQIIPFIYDAIWDKVLAESFSEGMAVVRKDGKCGYVDKSGKELVPFIYDTAYDFKNGMAGVSKDDKWGFIDKTGKEIVPCIYDWVSSFNRALSKL